MSIYTPFEWLTLSIWFLVLIVLVYGIVAIHDIPASIARKRNHPHTDAIEAAGWVSLFMLHALWPFLWIWAMTYKPSQEEIAKQPISGKREAELIETLKSEMKQLQKRLDRLEAKDA